MSHPTPITIHTPCIRYGRYLQSLVGQLGLEAGIDCSDQFPADIGGDGQSGLVIVDFEKWTRSLSFFLQENGVPAIYLSNNSSGSPSKRETTEIVLHKPLDPEQFVSSVERLYTPSQKRTPRTPAQPYLLGNSPQIKEIRRDIQKISNTDMTVLLLGETGSGKGVLARALHNNSARNNSPFVEVNCANIPYSLMESEFFGYKRGAFTGAWSDKTGKFELASNGTIFLDEISEMTRNMQAKLLQVLQGGEFSPVGGVDNLHVNVRIIAATNAPIKKLVSSGGFRLDLYYRLAVLRFYLPPLKERKEDIHPLSMFFLEKYASQYDKPLTFPSSKLWKMLEEHDWPGNVRELENSIKTLVALESESFVIEEMMKKGKNPKNNSLKENKKIQELAERDIHSKKLKEITEKEVAIAEKELIHKALNKTNGNKKKAAEMIQISYKSILNKIKMYGL